MGDSTMQSGAYENCLSANIHKRKMMRLCMPMMNRCSSKRGKPSSYDHHAFNGHEDLIWEILFRLPPKHVLRFKSVSRTWYSIISNPAFLRNYSLRFHHHFPQPPHEFLLLPQNGEGNDLVLNLLDYSPDQPLALSGLPITGVLPVAKDSDFMLIDSCNGLLLYADAHIKKEDREVRCLSRVFTIGDYYDDPYYVCNPVTKNYVKLPNLIALLFKEDENKTALINNIDTHILFDPSVSLSYQVIRFLCRNVTGRHGLNNNEFEFYIYSSESGSWRLSASIVGTIFFRRTGLLLNGVLYWVTYGPDLLCFDVEKNSIWVQPLPPKPRPNFHRRTFYFGECGGRLCLIEKYALEYEEHCSLTLYDGFDIMEMAVEDGRWIKKCRVNFEANHHNHLSGAVIQILHVYKTGNKFDEEEMLMKIDGKLIVSFSLKSNTFGKELTIPNSKRPISFTDVYPCSITLFPL